mgnify:CR=1 FL=1
MDQMTNCASPEALPSNKSTMIRGIDNFCSVTVARYYTKKIIKVRNIEYQLYGFNHVFMFRLNGKDPNPFFLAGSDPDMYMF